MIELLAPGVRYRLANGLRRAMRVWGVVIVAGVVARGLNAQPAIDAWIAAWRAAQHPIGIAFAAAFAVAVSVRPMLARALRANGQRDFMVLPMTAAQRFAIDAGSAALFMIVPYGVLLAFGVAAGRGVPTGIAIATAIVAVVATLGDRERQTDQATDLPLTAFPHEIRWLLRGRGIVASVVFTAVAMGGARLAIHNNGITSTHAIARINGVFGAIAALVLATAITRARAATRHFRATETTLPVSTGTRLGALCIASVVCGLPLIFAGLAAPFAFVLLTVIVLAGEHVSLQGEKREWLLNGIGMWAALVAAFDARVATIGAFVLLPFAWSLATASDRGADLPVIAEAD